MEVVRADRSAYRVFWAAETVPGIFSGRKLSEAQTQSNTSKNYKQIS